MEIRTNNRPRDLLYGFELTTKERENFDYLAGDELDGESFFRYRGAVYAMSDFMCTSGELLTQGWQGIATDTYFSATLVKVSPDGESVIVGRAFS